MRLVGRAGDAVPVSPLLFEAVDFALQLARASSGAFDPTIGATLEQMGFNVEYRTGKKIHSPVTTASNYNDVHLDRRTRTIRLRTPLVLDLNAVAKGLAIDLAARELHDVPNLCIE